MLIDPQKLDDSVFEYDVEIEPSEIDLKAKFLTLVETARVSGKVKKEDWVVRISGASTVKLRRKCDRCLSTGEVTESFVFDSAYVNYRSLNEERETELDILGLDYSITENKQIDLKEVFTEHLLISVPDRFTCSADCKGLCPDCGANKNIAECECEKKVVDPRWAALTEIKEDLDK